MVVGGESVGHAHRVEDALVQGNTERHARDLFNYGGEECVAGVAVLVTFAGLSGKWMGEHMSDPACRASSEVWMATVPGRPTWLAIRAVWVSR